MHEDELKIRELVATWMSATKSGDTETVLSLMSDDAVFLVPGQPVMTKADFAAAADAQSTGEAPQFDGASEIEEITLAGNWAFVRTRLTVNVKPPGSDNWTTRAGHTLSVLRKENGRWVLARDANLLVPVASEQEQ